MSLTPDRIDAALIKSFPSLSIRDVIVKCATECNVTAYLGGGTLRDIAYEHGDIADFDFFVEGTSEGTTLFTHQIRERLGQLPATSPHLDFSSCKSTRFYVHQFDFSIHSILYNLHNRAITCPTSGLRDLEQRVLRMNSSTFFSTSYRSFVRTFRLAATRKLTVDVGVKQCIENHHPMLAYASPVVRTKVYLELISLLSVEQTHRWLSEVERLGVLGSLLPHLRSACRAEGTPSWELDRIRVLGEIIARQPATARNRLKSVEVVISRVADQVFRVETSLQACLGFAILISRIGNALQALDPLLPEPFTKREFAINARRSLLRDLMSGLVGVPPLVALVQQAILLNDAAERIQPPNTDAAGKELIALYQSVLSAP